MKYIRLFENKLSDTVQIGDYVYHHQNGLPPFIVKIINTNPKVVLNGMRNGISYTYSEEITDYISVELMCFKNKNNEWKLCNDIATDNRRKEIFKTNFDRDARNLTPEELEEVEYLINAGEYNL